VSGNDVARPFSYPNGFDGGVTRIWSARDHLPIVVGRSPDWPRDTASTSDR
jgi:hypothetical protein